MQSDIQNAVDVVDTASDDLNASIASLGETQNTMSMLSDAQTDISTSNDELIGSFTGSRLRPGVDHLYRTGSGNGSYPQDLLESE